MSGVNSKKIARPGKIKHVFPKTKGGGHETFNSKTRSPDSNRLRRFSAESPKSKAKSGSGKKEESRDRLTSGGRYTSYYVRPSSNSSSPLVLRPFRSVSASPAGKKAASSSSQQQQHKKADLASSRYGICQIYINFYLKKLTLALIIYKKLFLPAAKPTGHRMVRVVVVVVGGGLL